MLWSEKPLFLTLVSITEQDMKKKYLVSGGVRPTNYLVV